MVGVVWCVLGGGSGLMVRADDDQQDLVDGEEDPDASVESEDIVLEGAESETGNMDAAATATDTEAEKVMLFSYSSCRTNIQNTKH